MIGSLRVVPTMLWLLAAFSFSVSTMLVRAQTPLHGQAEAITPDPCDDPNHEDFGFIGKPKKTWDMLVCAEFADSTNRNPPINQSPRQAVHRRSFWSARLM
jgi:hypothetical protein